jgi:organic radical activating enzyme
MTKLLINEIFGPTIQGEGPAAGRRCAFVRLAICPLECRWCDTLYTWAFTEAKAAHHDNGIVYDREAEVHPMDVEYVYGAAIAAAGGSGMVVISGGEPLAQIPPRLQGAERPFGDALDEENDPLGLLVYKLNTSNIDVHIETAGIRKPSEGLDMWVHQYVVSPKLESSGNRKVTRYRPKVLDFFAGSDKADFKFVITDTRDLAEVDQIVDDHLIPRSRVWLMPEGVTPEAIQSKTQMVAEASVARGYNFSSRLHVLAWGDQRGY